MKQHANFARNSPPPRYCRFYLASLLLLAWLWPTQAQGTDFAETHYYTLQYRQQIDDYLAGRLDMSDRYNQSRIKYMCGYVQSDFAAVEMGKLKYNDLFGEVKNDEHARDIQRLNEALEKEKDCKKRFRIWIAYDNKWYYEQRKTQNAKNKEQEKLWASQVVDTGADVWDGVINGTFFAIPRKYMWAGRNKPDGFDLGINLRFFFPEMESKSSQNSKENTDLNVLLEQAIIKKELPCLAQDKEICTRHTYQMGAWATQYLDCSSQDTLPDRHNAVWRKACKYKEGQKKDLAPVFDEEVGMWRIGVAGYYEGTPEFPGYWLICGKPGTDWNKHYAVQSCTDAVYVTDGVYAQYHFRQKEGFWHHREIHDQLQKKLQSFIVKTNKPYLTTGE
jgi:hypothetical protein